jgi:alkanesulfonate monooxygenase SsuD/methylene tetrahydromethanopterin reductase-like flavin-dependent oxidoreductase (luciferase family)
MKIGVNLGPTDDWSAMLAAAQAADALGFETVGFLDHYHASNLEWSYHAGWSLYGALAMATSRIHLLPLVIDRMNYLPGVLAKESAALALLSGGRFELGIGAGDFFEEARAWGLSVPAADIRVAELKETIQVLRQIWSGRPVNFHGEYIQLTEAAIAPPPPVSPRIVVGAGNSRRLIRSALEYADEINIYADDELIHFVREEIKASGRAITLSVFVWEWLEDIVERLHVWEQQEIERTYITFWHPFEQLPGIAELIK